MKRRLKIILLTFSVGLILFNCNSNSDTSSNADGTENPTVPKNFKLISLGDSYTIGQSVCESCRFPAQLKDSLQARYTELDTFNLEIIAQTGWTTTNLKNAISSADPQTDFDLITLLIGVNNQYQNKPFELYETEFVELVSTAISLVGGDASKLIVVSIPDYAFTPFGNGNPSISQEIDNFNLVNQAITDSIGVSYFDITPISREGLDKPELVASDNLHPSGIQYSRWVELFYDEVKLKVND